METLGSLVDKLVTVRMKLRVTEGVKERFDLMKQSSSIASAIDKLFDELREKAALGEKIDETAVVQRKHKKY